MIPDRYNMRNLKSAIANPSKLSNETRRVKSKTLFKLHHLIEKRLFEIKMGQGVDVMEKDWDNLIILDACRFDYFDEINDLNGESDWVTCKASQSEEFAKKTFSGGEFHDTVYVTGNGFGAQVDSSVFHDLIPTFGEDSPMHHSFDIDPEVVSRIAKDAYDKYPNKRLIVHFMQPHCPYFGPRAEELRTQLEKEGIKFTDWKSPEKFDEEDGIVLDDLYTAVEEGYISSEQFKEIYIENLEYVMPYVKDLVNELDGKTVITADHGEILGEPASLFIRRRYGHAKEIYTQELRKVPWFVTNSGERREIIEEKPVESSEPSKGEINKHLEALGYKT